MTRHRLSARVAALVVATSAALAPVVLGASPASASAYRYWSYWHGTSTGGWAFSAVGATYRPPAGSVDGWRFAVSGTAGSVQPRATASYASICAHHAAAPSGQKLVGLVVDYGTSADAPPGQRPPRGVDTFCAQVADNGASAAVLQQYASVRSDSGLVCGIDGYPSGECGVIVQPPSPKPTPRPTPKATSHTPAPTATGSRPSTGGSTPPHSGAAAVGGSTTPSPGPGRAEPGGTGTAVGSSSGDPQPVAVGAGGVPDRGGASGGPPVGALAGVALVLAVGGAAAVRALRGTRGRGAP